MVAQRTVKIEVIRREAPTTKSKNLNNNLKVGDVGNFTHWVKGENVNGNNVWFKGISGNYFWSGCFTSTSTAGLIEEKTPTKPSPPQPVKPSKSLKNITKEDIPNWIKFDEFLNKKVVGRTEKSWNDQQAQYYGKPYKPIEAHLHWWDDPSKKPTHNGTANYLKNTDSVNCNFIVSDRRITVNVPLSYLAWTTGSRNPYGWKIEADPALTESVYITMAALIYLVEKKNPELRKEPFRLHKEFSATSCSKIDLGKVRRLVEDFFNGVLDIETGKKVVQKPKKRTITIETILEIEEGKEAKIIKQTTKEN